MMRRAMALVAGLTVLAAPAAIAQEEQGEQGDHAEMRERAPHSQMRQRAHRGQMQRQGARAHDIDGTLGRLMDRQHELNLTEGQMSALGRLRGEARSSLAPLREQLGEIREGVSDGSMDREAARSAMEGLHEQMSGSMEGLHGQLGEILEPEQQAALRQGRGQRARHGAMRGQMRRQHGQMQRQHGRMQRQHGRMQGEHKRMQERKEAEEESASVDS